MDIMSIIKEIIAHSAFGRILAVLGCIILFYSSSRIFGRWVRELGNKRALGELRVRYIRRLLNIGMVFMCVVVVCLVLGLGYSEVTVFLSSIFAVVGIALFAQWSILSNITASMIIFFGFPYRVGDRIKVLDKDDDISGIIRDISMFHVIIRRDDGNKITYPNTLILQKAVLKIDFPLPKPEPKTETPLPPPAASNTNAAPTQA